MHTFSFSSLSLASLQFNFSLFASHCIHATSLARFYRQVKSPPLIPRSPLFCTGKVSVTRELPVSSDPPWLLLPALCVTYKVPACTLLLGCLGRFSRRYFPFGLTIILRLGVIKLFNTDFFLVRKFRSQSNSDAGPCWSLKIASFFSRHGYPETRCAGCREWREPLAGNAESKAELRCDSSECWT